jgi:hypothetical protein
LEGLAAVCAGVNDRKPPPAPGVDQPVTGEITVGTFDYRKPFPNDTGLRDFYAEEGEQWR